MTKIEALEIEREMNTKAFENNEKVSYGMNLVSRGVWGVFKFDRSNKMPVCLGQVA